MTRSPRLVGAVAALIVIVAAALAVVAFAEHGSSYGRLNWLGQPSSQAIDRAHAGPVARPWVFGSYNPCVTAGPVTVTGFAFTKASGLVMTGWGHKPNTGNGIGAWPETIKNEPSFHTGEVEVTLPCSTVNEPLPTNLGILFIVEVHRTTTATAWANGLTVTYRSGRASHVSHWPVSFALCGDGPAPGEQLAGMCPTTSSDSSLRASSQAVGPGQ